MSEIQERVNKVLIPLLAAKTFDKAALESLNQKVDELADYFKDNDYVPRVLTGILWEVFCSLLAESEYLDNRDEIELAAWCYKEHLIKVYGPIIQE